MRGRLAAIGILVATVGIAGVATGAGVKTKKAETATKVTSSSATLNALGSGEEGERVFVRWEWRKPGESTWTTSSWQGPWTLGQRVTDWPISKRITGLPAQTTYQYRVCGYREEHGGWPAAGSASSPICFDSQGTGASSPYTNLVYTTLHTDPPSDTSLRFIRRADTAFDPIWQNATPAEEQWMHHHYEWMRGWVGAFDSARSWTPPVTFYRDVMAIYGPPNAPNYPQYVLNDPQGNHLYVDYDCGHVAWDGHHYCTQYAADIGDPAYRQFLIDGIRDGLAAGYAGVFLDDVNLWFTVSDGDGDFVRPQNPRTGQPMTDAEWEDYMEVLIDEIRAAFPHAYLIENTHWRNHSDDLNDPESIAVVEDADAVEVEHAFSDTGIGCGSGTFGYDTYLNYMDWLHQHGADVHQEPDLSNNTERDFTIASHFLVRAGDDAIAARYQADPSNWYSGWDEDLGTAQGARYTWNGLLRRDFVNGSVLVYPPCSGGPITVTLYGREITLNPREGTVVKP